MITALALLLFVLVAIAFAIVILTLTVGLLWSLVAPFLSLPLLPFWPLFAITSAGCLIAALLLRNKRGYPYD